MKGLCINCLEYGKVAPVDVGPERGSQRDPWREKLQLCAPCGDALTSGVLSDFVDRFSAERVVVREAVEPEPARPPNPGHVEH